MRNLANGIGAGIEFYRKSMLCGAYFAGAKDAVSSISAIPYDFFLIFFQM